MSKKSCTICKHYGIETPDELVDDLEKTHVYDERGTSVPLLLCRKHSVDLFKTGQKRFLLSHQRILVDLVGSEEMKFIEILTQTVRRNPGKVY